MLLDRTAGVIRKCHQRACDTAWAAGERSPIIREGRILPIHDNGNLRYVGEADLPPQRRLTVRPEELASRPHGSQPIEVGLKHSTGVNDEVEGGHATKKLGNSGRDHTAWTGHAFHLGNDLFNFRDNSFSAGCAVSARGRSIWR